MNKDQANLLFTCQHMLRSLRVSSRHRQLCHRASKPHFVQAYFIADFSYCVHLPHQPRPNQFKSPIPKIPQTRKHQKQTQPPKLSKMYFSTSITAIMATASMMLATCVSGQGTTVSSAPDGDLASEASVAVSCTNDYPQPDPRTKPANVNPKTALQTSRHALLPILRYSLPGRGLQAHREQAVRDQELHFRIYERCG